MTSGSLLTFREDCVPGATTTMSSIFARCLAGNGDAGYGREREQSNQYADSTRIQPYANIALFNIAQVCFLQRIAEITEGF